MTKDEKKVIEVVDLVTHYGARKILDGVSMSVKEGEIMVIMGGSGSGKSTLLRYLMALEKQTSGSISLLQQNIENLNQKEMFELRKKNWRRLSRGCFIQLNDNWRKHHASTI